jgi:polysaccharide pyruvyl transferase WcaK-like protein
VTEAWPDAEIVFHNYGHRARELPSGRLRSLLRERVTGRLGMMDWFRSFDLVLDTRSGDSFADIYGLHRLAIMTAVAQLAEKAGVPVVLSPQTIGPFNSPRGQRLARRSLHATRVVMSRDTASADYAAAELGILTCVRTTDVVFALPRPIEPKTRDVVLNVSGLLWSDNPHVDAARYREVLAGLYHSLSMRGRTVSLLAHVLDSPNHDNDVYAINAFAASIGGRVEVIIPEGLDEVRSVVASAAVVIGSRMHACLNALSVGTPAIPLAYSRKFDSLLRDLGWEHTVDLRSDADAVNSVLAILDRPTLADEVQSVITRADEALDSARTSLAGLASVTSAA